MGRPKKTARRASAAPWILAALAVAVLLGAAAWVMRGAAGGPPAPLAPVDAAAIAQLQENLTAVITGGGDVRPLIERGRRLVQRRPDSSVLRVSLAQALMTGGRGREAYEQFTAALEIDPDQPQVHVLAGSLAMKLDRPDEGEAHYNRAIESDPRRGDAWMHRAQARMRRGASDDARGDLEEALRLDSSLHAAHGMLSDIDAGEDRLDSALKQIRRALALTPAKRTRVRLDYTLRHADLLRRSGEPREAVRLLRELTADQLLEESVAVVLAACCEQLGEPRRCAETFREIARELPTEAAAARRAADWFIRAGDRDRALKMIERLRWIDAHHPDLPDLRARASSLSAGPVDGVR